MGLGRQYPRSMVSATRPITSSADLILCSVSLYGLTTLQTYVYYGKSGKDSPLMKSLVRVRLDPTTCAHAVSAHLYPSFRSPFCGDYFFCGPAE